MRSFYLAGNFVISLLGRLAYELSLPHEFVPVDTTRPTLAALAACEVRTILVASTPVDHGPVHQWAKSIPCCRRVGNRFMLTAPAFASYTYRHETHRRYGRQDSPTIA